MLGASTHSSTGDTAETAGQGALEALAVAVLRPRVQASVSSASSSTESALLGKGEEGPGAKSVGWPRLLGEGVTEL